MVRGPYVALRAHLREVHGAGPGAAGVLAPSKRQELDALYQSLNPLQLRRDLEAALERLWTLAAPDPLRSQGDTEVATPTLKSSPGGT